MPHINLLYPFVPEPKFDLSAEKLASALKNIEPFELTFSSMGHFKHGNSCTLYADPTTLPRDALKPLQKTLEQAFPFCNDLSTKSSTGFTPHLTLGQFTTESQTEAEKSKFMKAWEPITWTVSEVHLISRTAKDPFKIIKTVRFGQSGPNNQRILTDEERNKLPPAPPNDQDFERPNRFPDCCASVLEWINKSNSEKLPKSKLALLNALKRRCGFFYTVGTSERSIQVLLAYGYVEIPQTGKLKYYKPQEHAEIIQKLRRRNQTDYVVVDLRVLEWVYSQEIPSLPTTKAKLQHSLEHIILMKDEIDPERVVDHLVERGIIEFDSGKSYESEKLVYHPIK